MREVERCSSFNYFEAARISARSNIRAWPQNRFLHPMERKRLYQFYHLKPNSRVLLRYSGYIDSFQPSVVGSSPVGETFFFCSASQMKQKYKRLRKFMMCALVKRRDELNCSTASKGWSEEVAQVVERQWSFQSVSGSNPRGLNLDFFHIWCCKPIIAGLQPFLLPTYFLSPFNIVNSQSGV